MSGGSAEISHTSLAAAPPIADTLIPTLTPTTGSQRLLFQCKMSGVATAQTSPPVAPQILVIATCVRVCTLPHELPSQCIALPLAPTTHASLVENARMSLRMLV